eukprot:1140361-Pelagomonas_calceolata.AAC.2
MATGGSVLYPCFRTHIFYVYYTPTGLANPGLLAVQFADMATKLRNIKTTCVTLVTTHDACKLHCRVDHKTHWHTDLSEWVLEGQGSQHQLSTSFVLSDSMFCFKHALHNSSILSDSMGNYGRKSTGRYFVIALPTESIWMGQA